jgi:hypothetical protein
MSTVATEAFYPRLNRCGRVQCATCGAIFDFGPYDIRDGPTVWAIERYQYLECPNGDCRERAILRDFRLLGPLWRRLWGQSLVTMVPADQS